MIATTIAQRFILAPVTAVRARKLPTLWLSVALPIVAFTFTAAGPALAEGSVLGKAPVVAQGNDEAPTPEVTEDEGAAEEAIPEEGPLWTEQMAKISLALAVLTGLAIVGAYYRFVVSRSRGEP